MHTSIPLASRGLEGPKRNAFRGQASVKMCEAAGYQTVGNGTGEGWPT